MNHRRRAASRAEAKKASRRFARLSRSRAAATWRGAPPLGAESDNFAAAKLARTWETF